MTRAPNNTSRGADRRCSVICTQYSTLSVGPPRTPFKTIATPEGHAVDYDESGAVMSMVLVNVKFLLDRDGALTVTLPPDRVLAAKIEPALIAA